MHKLMSVKLKKIKDQVIVITGASSGIGLTTARLAAKQGAKLVLVARNEDALRNLVAEIRASGGQAEYVAADVGVEGWAEKASEVARRRFGGFDTWINIAGVGIWGKIMEGSINDYRRLFDTNYWGVVYGSMEAAHGLKGRAGGAIINVGSVVSDRVVHMQGIYSTSKHAVKGFTDALRMELEAEHLPIQVTLLQPSAIDTPFPQHARNYMDEEPSLPPPVYAPRLVAEALLHCAAHPERDMIVGGGGKQMSLAEQFAPTLTDKAMETPTFVKMNKGGKPPKQPQGALHAPTFGGQERGEYEGHVRETSLYTKAVMHPAVAGGLLLAAAGLTLGALLLKGGGSSPSNGDGANGAVTDLAVTDGVVHDLTGDALNSATGDSGGDFTVTDSDNNADSGGAHPSSAAASASVQAS